MGLGQKREEREKGWEEREIKRKRKIVKFKDMKLNIIAGRGGPCL